MERFILQRSKEDKNLLVCTDTTNKIVCRFEFGKFNETQQFTMLEDCDVNANQLATIMSEFGDYLFNNHYFSAMPYNDELCRVYLANTIKKHRERLGWSVYQLSKSSCVQITNIQRIENGQYSARFDTVMRLLVAMNIDISYL